MGFSAKRECQIPGCKKQLPQDWKGTAPRFCSPEHKQLDNRNKLRVRREMLEKAKKESPEKCPDCGRPWRKEKAASRKS